MAKFRSTYYQRNLNSAFYVQHKFTRSHLQTLFSANSSTMAQVLSQSALNEWTNTQPKRNVSTKVTHQKSSTTTARLTATNKMASAAIKVGVWDLQTSELNEFQPPENTESLFNGRADESVIGADGRKKVSKKHLLPGGQYRGTHGIPMFCPEL
jgi:hypothetical protein